ncbi:MAG: hypothetical protein GSR85_02305 [Desulfurococcales archaeon]|nr:hypothetical protein [Desulfurococcales archaeon]
MLKTYNSNLYKNVIPEPIAIKVYVAYLRKEILEYMVWREINKLVSSGLKEAYLSVVTHGKLYTSSHHTINKLSNFIGERSVKVVTITNDNEEHSKIIGRLTYRSLDLFLRSRGFMTITSKAEKGKRIYYKDDPIFVLKVKKRKIATFKAIRGLMPKIYANVPGTIYLFFVPDGSHVIEVHDWNAFMGEEVKIKRGYLEELDKRGMSYSKIFKLENLEDNNAIVTDAILNVTLKVPLSEVYVPANTRLLHKFGVSETLQAFTSFRERKEMTEYRFLEIVLEKILPDKEEFTLKVGLTDVVFHRVSFRLEEET